MTDTKVDRRYELTLAAVATAGIVLVVGICAVAMPLEALSLFISVAVPIGALWFAAFQTSIAAAERWALARGARLDGDVLTVLHRHLVRTRLARTLGVMAVVLINGILMARYNADPESFKWFVKVWNVNVPPQAVAALGYAVACVWSEWAKPRPSDGQLQGAAITPPRRVRDFVDLGLQRTAFVAAGVAAALILFAAFWPNARSYESNVRWPAFWLSMATILLAFGGSIWICRRPERVADDASLAFEELTRSSAVNALFGVAVAAMVVCVSALGSPSRLSPINGAWSAIVALAGLLSIGIWSASGTSFVFRSRRIDSFVSAGADLQRDGEQVS